jgi:hypothetical protein
MANSSEKLKSLSDIFRDNVKYIIPDYQRGYSWGIEQLNDLWEDLENLVDGRFHYTGMFTFCKAEHSDNLYQIVDGQQRMTTLIILINELLANIQDGIPNGLSVEDYVKKYLYYKPFRQFRNEYRFQYSVDSPSNAFFRTQILGQEDSDSYNQPEQTLYTQNLKQAKEYFSKKIQEITQDELKSDELKQDELAKLFIKVTESLKFNEYIIEDIDEVYVTFETMNNRGKSLSSLELLKNRLIYLSTLFENISGDDPTNLANVKTLRENINNTWRTIYEYLGKRQSKALNDDSFLRDHWIMYFRYDRSTSKVFRSDLLSKTFTAKEVLSRNLPIEEVLKYVASLQKSIVCWFNITCPSTDKQASENDEWQTRLNRVGIGSFKPLLMAAYLHNKKDEVLPLIQACERFRFWVAVITARRSNKGDSHFYSLAHSYFRNENPNIGELIEDINTKTKEWTDLNRFVNECVDRYKDDGFYSWSGVRYFLYEYEKHLEEKNNGERKVNWEDFERNQDGKISIEHIFPQHPSPNDTYWSDRFKSKEDKALAHSLGNLLLLRQSKNSSLQNNPFNEKREKYRTGSNSEIEVAKYDEWTPGAIIKRGTEMLEFLTEHWKLKEFTQEQIEKFTQEQIDKLLNIKDVVYSENIATDANETAEETDVDENIGHQEDFE